MGSGVTCGKASLVFLGLLGLGGLSLAAQTPAKDAVQPELKLLQQKVVEREHNAGPATNAPRAAFGRALTFNEIEQLFLDGKITARQFQEYVQKLPPPSSPVAAAPSLPKPTAVVATNATGTAASNVVPQVTTLTQGGLSEEVQKKAVEILRATEPNPANNPKPGPAIQGNQIPPLKEEMLQPVDPIEQGFNEIEAKMDELLRWKAQREKASRTNAAPASSEGSSQPKTKRQRLDELLRLYIAGDLKEEDYKARRAAIVAEPEGK